jgi:hypothetical protein
MKLSPSLTGAIIAMALSPQLRAADITGSIDINFLEESINSGTFATATGFTPAQPSIFTETQVYIGAPLLTPVTLDGFQFDPPPDSTTPLWTFEVGPATYSLEATSMTASYNAGIQQWEIGGEGIATISGYNATPGTWSLDFDQSGGSILFDASPGTQIVPEVAAIPESSTLGLIALAVMARKQN